MSVSKYENKVLYVGRLNNKVSESDLKKAFKKYGDNIEVNLQGDYAFIEFDDVSSSRKAREEMSHEKINGISITV